MRNGVPPEYHARAESLGVDVHESAHHGGRGTTGRRARADRAGLAQRQPLGAGRPRTVRPDRRRDTVDAPRGRLPGAARVHRVRYAHHHRGVRDVRCAGGRTRRRGRPAEERAADADLRRRDATAAQPDRLRRRAQRWAPRCTPRWPPGRIPTSAAAAAAMGKVRRNVYLPDEARADVYDALYREYRELHDYSAGAATTSCIGCARSGDGRSRRDGCCRRGANGGLRAACRTHPPRRPGRPATSRPACPARTCS